MHILYTGMCAHKLCTIVDGCTGAYMHSPYTILHSGMHVYFYSVYTILLCYMLVHVCTSHIQCCVEKLMHWRMCTYLVYYDVM